MFEISANLMLHLVDNVSDRIVIEFIFCHEVPVAHTVMDAIVGNVYALLVRKLIILRSTLLTSFQISISQLVHPFFLYFSPLNGLLLFRQLFALLAIGNKAIALIWLNKLGLGKISHTCFILKH